jgi:photosystem II stability/assembly factor-like uncharacterized protein
MKSFLPVLISLLFYSGALAQTWTELNTGFNESLLAVFVSPQGKVIVAGTGGLFATSTDDGETWSPIDASDGEDIEDIYFFNENDGLILIKDAVLLTTDGGISFPLIAPLSGEFRDLTFSDALHGWAVGKDGAVNYTIDGGQTWNNQNAGTGQDLECIAFADNTLGLTVGTNSVARLTSNGGSNWSNAGVNGDEDFAAVAFPDINHAWIAGGGGEIFATTNGCASWSPQFPPVEEDFLCMSFIDASTGFIAGDNGTIISTENGGENWTLNSTTVSERINDIFMLSAEHGFAVGDNGTVLRFGSVSTGIPQATHTSFAVFPNPSSDQISIEQYGLRLIRIELKDLRGDLIQSTIPAGETSTISLVNLPNGIYTITGIHADGSMDTSKVVKL